MYRFPLSQVRYPTTHFENRASGEEGGRGKSQALRCPLDSSGWLRVDECVGGFVNSFDVIGSDICSA